MMPSARVAVLHRIGDDADGDQVVDLLELDLLALQLEEDAVQTLDASLDLAHRNLRFVELEPDGPLQLLDRPLGHAPAALDLERERRVRARVGGLERQLLQLVLDLAHAEPVGDRRVDVERLLGDPGATLLGQMIERPHVVEPIRELHHDDADVVHHRQQHLAEVLRLPLLARREGDGTELRDALDDVGDVRAEQLLDALDGRERVFDHVVQQAGRNGDDVEPHVGEDVGDLERMDEVRLPGMAHLSLVLERREHVGPAQQFDVRVRRYSPGPCRRDPRTESSGWCQRYLDRLPATGPAASSRSGTVPWSPQPVACRRG